MTQSNEQKAQLERDVESLGKEIKLMKTRQEDTK
jgi:hypothetical protein